MRVGSEMERLTEEAMFILRVQQNMTVLRNRGDVRGRASTPPVLAQLATRSEKVSHDSTTIISMSSVSQAYES